MVLKFLTEKGFLKGSMTQMKCQIVPKKIYWWSSNAAKLENEKPEVEYLPGPGDHIFTY